MSEQPRTAADAWQAGYEACWNRLNDAGRLLPSSPSPSEADPTVSWTDDPMAEAKRIAHNFPDGLVAWLLARLSADEEGGTP